MKNIISSNALIISALFISILVINTNSSGKKELSETVTIELSDSTIKKLRLNTQFKQVIKSNNKFCFSLYNKLKKDTGNVFFSPFSIYTAFGIVYAGARGSTAEEMKNVLKINLNDNDFHRNFKEVQEYLNSLQKKSNLQLSLANALWAHIGYPFLKSYINFVKNNYSAEVTNLDFIRKKKESIKTINKWVELKTNNKIRNLIESIQDSVKLIVTNAVYFKGEWFEEFKTRNTKERPFFLESGDSITVPTMWGVKKKISYYENDIMQLIELPYKGNSIGMIAILPKKPNKLEIVEKEITLKIISNWLDSTKTRDVITTLPKFKMVRKYNLEKTLKGMGMKLPFAFSAADFSGMDGTRNLKIDKVIHKSFVDVNEKGTEAAAATDIHMKRPLSMSRRAEHFFADHPFIFIIRDMEFGSILFIGRVTNPKN